ncbi:MAG TPA: NAD(P)/FAD-dependent oxidoreductase [Steroidobacteraceae bacterium]|nr:NAD(P)/FAD-dependent oxidoreductase [Steroidobacteraceae bacterium]
MIHIVGAGPAGCVLALLLARRGHEVHLHERRGDPRTTAPEAGRSINLALAARGMRALEHAGVMHELASGLVPMPGRQLHLADGSESFNPYGQNPGEINYSISRAELTRRLVERAGREPGIQLHFRRRCLGLAPAGMPLLLDEASGREIELAGQRVIAADGAGSALRKALAEQGRLEAREELLDHTYKELCIPARAGGSALAVREALHIWPRRGYMLIALPNADFTFTATLFMAHRGPVSFEALAAPGAARDFFRREFPDALAVMPDFDREFAAHREGLLGTVRCSRWNDGERVLLIGDAAHAIVPFHGQGMNCALEDCVVLDALMADGRPEPFARFSALRRPDGDAIADMSLENYIEMRDGVLDPRHQQHRRLELQLERLHPGHFIPRYAMVMFHDRIPYSVALQRARIQQGILEELTDKAAAADSPLAHSLVSERLPRLA